MKIIKNHDLGHTIFIVQIKDRGHFISFVVYCAINSQLQGGRSTEDQLFHRNHSKFLPWLGQPIGSTFSLDIFQASVISSMIYGTEQWGFNQGGKSKAATSGKYSPSPIPHLGENGFSTKKVFSQGSLAFAKECQLCYLCVWCLMNQDVLSISSRGSALQALAKEYRVEISVQCCHQPMETHDISERNCSKSLIQRSTQYIPFGI